MFPYQSESKRSATRTPPRHPLRGNSPQFAAILLIALLAFANAGFAKVGQTCEEAEKYYGKPVGEITVGGKTIRTYKKDGVTTTETYNEQGICIKSEVRTESQNNTTPKTHTPQPRNQYAQTPATPKKQLKKPPEETYIVNTANMWIRSKIKRKGYHGEIAADNGKVFYVVDIKVENKSDHTFTVFPWSFHIVAKDNSVAQGKWCYLGNEFDPQDLPPGTWSHGYVIFEIPREANYKEKELDRLTFEYAPSKFINAALPKKHNVAFMP